MLHVRNIELICMCVLVLCFSISLILKTLIFFFLPKFVKSH